MKATIASYSNVDVLLWYHEELQTPEVNELILKKLNEGEEPSFSYGKLMERLLYAKKKECNFYPQLVPIAERRLKSISLPLETPVVVIGDASGSMQVAVKTATIISSLLTVLTNADLRFFNNECFRPPIIPKTIEEVLRVAEEVKANGGTCNSAPLWESYEKKEIVKFFVMVTDEEENQQSNGLNWAPLFKKYLEEVNPNAKQVFVSFLRSQTEKGQMVKELEGLGLSALQFKLNRDRPDLTKLDTFLAMLSAETGQFKKDAFEYATNITLNGGKLSKVIALINKKEN